MAKKVSLQEAYIQGVSTRSVDDLVKAMGMTGVSKSQVSRLCVEIDERVDAFLNRPLEGEWPYVWLDATYIKVRRSGRIVSVAAIVAVAVNLPFRQIVLRTIACRVIDGRREVLGIAIQPSEAEVFWDEFLRSLADRGLRGVKLIIADEHKGLKAAAAKVLGATIQRCRVHFMRNALACVGKKDRPIVTAALRTSFDQNTLADSKEHWAKLIEAFQPRHIKLAELMLRAEDDVLAYKTFPKAHWQQIHSTNPLERLNKEIKRRTNVIGIFPNEQAIRRLVGALMLEQNDEWAVTRRYMTLETVAAICENNTMDPAKIAAL
jgi:transposase-like protein